MSMASGTQVVNVEKSRSQDCFVSKRVMPNHASLDSSHGLCTKKIKLDESSVNVHSAISQEIEYGSEDESDKWGQSLATAIDERLSTLQLLLPHGIQMEDDEVLRVLIEYVKELETEIKVYSSLSTDDCILHHDHVDDSPLQRRGLCIVPLSTLAKAL